MNISLYPIKLFFTQKIVLSTCILAILINTSMWAYILIVFPPRSETVFLHYNILFGVDLIGPWWRLLMTPTFGLIIILINLLISWFTYKYDQLITVIVLSSTVIMQIILALATYHIIFLNN